MALTQLLQKSVGPEKGIVARFDRRHRFMLSRIHDGHGFHVYVLENQARGEKILIERYLFDRFRAAFRQARHMLGTQETQNTRLLVDVNFRTDRRFSIVRGKDHRNELLIREAKPRLDSTGFLSVSQNALQALEDLLFHPNLRHPNDLLDRITTYHKLFQFSFIPEGSTSITSDLILRKEVLSEVMRYYPALGKRESGENTKIDAELVRMPVSRPKEKAKPLFKSRLAARDNDQAYQVDYEALFNEVASKKTQTTPKRPQETVSKQHASQRCFMLPILAGDVKASDGRQLRCDFDSQHIQMLRESLLTDRESEFYLGIEILDCIYKKSNKLFTFRFPLYYLRVTLEESGRRLQMYPEGNRIFLNHLALANLIESFTQSKAGRDGLDEFFKTLSSQTFQVENFSGRVRIMRRLPVHEDVFSRTREILMGFPGENGKGGLLAGLALVGIECDLESVGLYKSPKPTAPTVAALESDLDHILQIASIEPERFYESLLGRFLTPGVALTAPDKQPFYKRRWIPGALPKSTRYLLSRTNDHDLVLLEGPPGTGKTHTIINLLIHCIASGKRLLVVSDKQAAIQALVERLQGYILGRERQSAQTKQLEALWRLAIKVVDLIPTHDTSLPHWASQLRSMLRVDNTAELSWPAEDAGSDGKLDELDQRMAHIHQQLDDLLAEYYGHGDENARVARKKDHPHGLADQEAILALARVLDRDREDNLSGMVADFISDRRKLNQSVWESCYSFFDLSDQDLPDARQQFSALQEGIGRLSKAGPRRRSRLTSLIDTWPDGPLKRLVSERFDQAFLPDSSLGLRAWRKFKSLFGHPLRNMLKDLQRLVTNQVRLFASRDRIEQPVWVLLCEIHQALRPDAQNGTSLVLELARTLTAESPVQDTVQGLLDRLQDLQQARDDLVRKRFLTGLSKIGQRALALDHQGGTNRMTSILAALDNLEAFGSLTNARAVLQDLQRLLYNTYPVWICHKRAVPFLFPCLEQSFDLIIVDEATQCRVDDALPLLYRAKKIMAVGDERQTVLAKESVIDDYLFRDFDLDEHLRTAQAHGIKGGGTHLFGLVKRIKQAAVLLDEHYRCPPDIIAYSNRYVYNDELKIMQWRMAGKKPAVVVDYTEKDTEPGDRKPSASFRGVDTDMVDRFMNFVARCIKDLEKKTGKSIDAERNVALCYFLLKNEPYVKHVKSRFLSKLRGGGAVLDGAGAALQGKERDYIFYLWDVTRQNLKFFAMGDDITKRKGELNVLMTRARRGAFHYLHRDFDKLSHGRASITEYLWQTYQKSGTTDSKTEPMLASADGDAGEITGELLRTLLQQAFCDAKPMVSSRLKADNCQLALVVGDPTKIVDLVLLPDRLSDPAIGLVDLSGFADTQNPAQQVIDHYFQLKRAIPRIEPVFTFVHEAAKKDSYVLKRIRQLLA